MKLLLELWFPVSNTVKLWRDNRAAIHIANNLVFHERTKHIKLDCHFIQDKVKEKLILLEHINSCDQVADELKHYLQLDNYSSIA